MPVDALVVLDGWDEGVLDPPLARVSTAVAVDDSTLALYDGVTGIITVVTGVGRVLVRFGRKGDGPGEFRGVSGLAVVDGRLLVFDQSARRVSTFSMTGEFITSVPTRNLGLLAGRNFFLLPPDEFAIRTSAVGGSGGHFFEVYAVATGEVRDSLFLPVQDGWEGMSQILQVPFEPHIVATLGPRKILTIARTDRYELIRREGQGVDTLFGLREPPPIDAVERDNYQKWAEYVSNAGGSTVAKVIPERKPIIRGLWTASDGSTVVELHTEGVLRSDASSRLGPDVPQVLWTDLPVYDVFDGSGDFRGRLELPVRSRLLDLRFPVAWIVRSDPLGVQRLERWTLGVTGEADRP